MDQVGILKEIDKLGRIVIPMEFRRRYGFGDQIELVATKEGVLIKNAEYVLVHKDQIKK